MGWTGYPVVADTQYAVWTFIRQTYYAVQERFRALGNCIWPRANRQWETGTVPAGITETSFTDSSKSGHWSTVNTCPPWTDSGTGGTPCPAHGPCDGGYQGPISWRLIIDDPAAEMVVEADITSWTGSGTLNFHNIRDYVTSGQIPSVASLVGKTYYIIKVGGIWWSDRIMEWPNAYEFAEGTVRTYTASSTDPSEFPASPTHNFIRDDKGGGWVDNEHVGRDLLLYGDDGFLKRVTITSNTFNTLHFSTQTWTPVTNSPYCVVEAGARAIPGRAPLYELAWFRGYMDSWASHDVFDTDAPGNITAAGMPTTWACIPGVPCGGTVEDCPNCRQTAAWDVDVWTEPDEITPDDCTCGRQLDVCYTPDYWKTIRSLQAAVEALSYSYVETAAMAGGVNAGIAYLGGADIFRANSINTYTGTTGNVQGAVGNDGSTNNQITVTLTSTTGLTFPCQVHVSIHRSNGVRTQGRGLLVNSTTLLGEVTTTACSGSNVLNFTQALDQTVTDSSCLETTKTVTRPGDNGATVYISTGWTGYGPLEFKRMFRVDGVFIGDVITPPLGDPFVQDPAQPSPWTPDPDNPTVHSCYGVGRYVKRAASTHLIERRRQVNDYSVTQGFSDEGDAYTYCAFTTGMIARYGGDDFYGPSVTTGGNDYIDLSTSPDITAPYWDRFFTGDGLSQRHQYYRHRQLGGYVTAAGTFFIQDKGKNWFDYQWFGGTMRTDIGTATSGSSTSLADNTKIDPDPGAPSVQGHCYWAASRFVGFAGPYVGFTVEIDRPETDDNGNAITVTYKRLIVTGNETTIAITWNEPLVDRHGTTFSASGLVYRIKEPYYLNRWIDRQLILIEPNGAKHTTTIIGNADDTIFFTPIMGVTPDKDWRYVIKDPSTGTLWKWDGSKWQPLLKGADTNRLGVPTGHAQNFHNDSTQNLPWVVQRNGRYTIGDYLGPHIFNELHDTINSLKTSTAEGVFTNKSSDSDPGTTPNSFVGGTNPVSQFSGQIDCSTPSTELVNCATGFDYGYSLVSFITSQWGMAGNQSVVGSGTPQSTATVQLCVSCNMNGNCNISASATAFHYKISVNTCGISHTTTYWCYGQIDALDSDPRSGGTKTGTCPPEFVDLGICAEGDPFSCCDSDLQFQCVSGQVGFRVWTQFGSSSGSGGNEYSGLLGSTSLPETINPTSCGQDPTCAGCCTNSGSATSGYYVARAIAFLTHNFVYHA